MRKLKALRGVVIVAAAILTATMLSANAVTPVTVEMYRGESCHCCGPWIEHLESEGFAVSIQIVDDLTPLRERYGVPKDLAGCHFATVGNYFIEGHVPAQDIRKLLEEQPAINGIAVIGMPDSFPGTAATGKPFDVLAITDDRGSIEIFTSYYRD